jgi:hypothetical protein
MARGTIGEDRHREPPPARRVEVAVRLEINNE